MTLRFAFSLYFHCSRAKLFAASVVHSTQTDSECRGPEPVHTDYTLAKSCPTLVDLYCPSHQCRPQSRDLNLACSFLAISVSTATSLSFTFNAAEPLVFLLFHPARFTAELDEAPRHNTNQFAFKDGCRPFEKLPSLL